jgi:hypothetical protein
MIAPVALFVYKRLDHLRNVVSALKENDLASETELVIFSDGPRTGNDVKHVVELRTFLSEITGFKLIRIVSREHNMGLANSIIQGVTEVCEEYGRVIVVEDDIVPSSSFLAYMNRALDYYESFPRVFSVGGFTPSQEFFKLPDNYPYDVYFSHRGTPWGWGTWIDRWNRAIWDTNAILNSISQPFALNCFNSEGSDLSEMLTLQHNGSIDSWWIRWVGTHFIHGAICVLPRVSFTDNIGQDGTGVHCSFNNRARNKLLPCDTDVIRFVEPFQLNAAVQKCIADYWTPITPIWKQILHIPRRIRCIIGGRHE